MRGQIVHYPQAIPTRGVVWGEGCQVGQFTTLGRLPVATAANRREIRHDTIGELHIGARSVVGDHATLYAGTWIGADACIGDGAIVREHCRIGDRCVIGTMVDIQYGAMIGDDVRILNAAHIAGGTHIGSGSFIGPGVRMANDRTIDLEDYQDRDTRQAPNIGRKVFVGVGAIILPGVTIGDGAVIAAGAVVVHDVKPGDHILARTVRGVPQGGRIDTNRKAMDFA